MEPLTPRVLLSSTHRSAASSPEYEHTIRELTGNVAKALNRAGAAVEELDSGLSYVPKLTDIDGVIICGDADVDPANYADDWSEEQNRRRRRDLRHLNTDADAVEIAIIKEALGAQIPVLGLGRGMQILNVALEGTLLPPEEVPYSGSVSAAGMRPHHFPERVCRPLTDEDGNSVYEHAHPVLGEADQVRVLGGTTLSAALDNSGSAIGIITNSRMAVKNIGPGLRVSATTTDGHIEALERDRTAFDVPLVAKAGWILAVNWHPEEPRTPMGQLNSLIESFMAPARMKAKRRKSS
ncbi:gamma-glutamyl-gamma-aminobutyrate hydrolase family protein [Micrococcoides hystricis]|uniref:Gamma-glutamyl-gamma-aminobutyrate hydrolase family protein n=1 Tax=Micrococcoides hystricis TaxID=1572761 RepID=A0ABV6PCU1_9MICC